MLSNEMLKYHYHPKKGWINDPNGLCFFNGYFHIYYQHAPNNEVFTAPIVWGHTRTKDFINYEEMPIAIPADMPYDSEGIYSGTAVEKDGVLYAYYASICDGGKQRISVAYSKDGNTFTKYDGNPVIKDIPADGSDDFRDPAILRCEYGNFLVIASGDTKKKTGNLLLYKSDDMLNWDYVGVMHEYENARCCECPSFVKYKDGYILATSVLSPDYHYFEVMYGDFDGKKFVPKITSRFQKGPDEYAGQIFSDPNGRCILISWIPGWDYRPEEKCIGCMSLPLELIVENDYIRAYPIKEVEHLIDADDTVTDAYIKETYIDKGREVKIELIEKP